MIINRSVTVIYETDYEVFTRWFDDTSAATCAGRRYIDCDVNPTSLPCAFWDLVNFIPVEGESKSIFYNVFESITEHSFLCICKVSISKEFVRFSYSLGRKESFSRRILMPMSMSIQFPLQFNAFNVRLVVAGSCVTLIKGQIPYGELIISFERSKIPFTERIISFRRAKIPFGEKFIIAFGRQINPVLFLALTFFGRQWTTSFWKLRIRP